MTLDPAVQIPLTLPMEPTPPPPSRASRSLFRQAAIDTFARPGAKIGSTWIGLLVALAVLAPYIANTRPIAMKLNGAWQFPLFRELTTLDVILTVIGLAAAVAVVVRKLRKRGFVWAVLVASVAIGTGHSLFLKPKELTNYEGYRYSAQDGGPEKTVRTLIPFSPLDNNGDEFRDVPRDAPVELRTHPRPPSGRHWFGTEKTGGDMLSIMIHAARVALTIGLISTGIAVVIGCIVGGIMGYFAGLVDLLGMRVIEIIEAIPRLVLLLAVAALMDRNLYLFMVVLGLTGWTGDARFIRAEFLRLRNLDFVQAATATGLPLRSVLFRHMLPNALTPVLISSSFGVASAILLESVLSFLGLGDPERRSWGYLLNQARSGGSEFRWWIAIFPGVAIFLTVLSYNLIGEALRDALDPKLRKRD